MTGCYQLSKRAKSILRAALIAVALIQGIILDTPVWAQSAELDAEFGQYEEECSATHVVEWGEIDQKQKLCSVGPG